VALGRSSATTVALAAVKSRNAVVQLAAIEVLRDVGVRLCRTNRETQAQEAACAQ
jgi:hypothetical protein